jgi:hypothetical protein
MLLVNDLTRLEETFRCTENAFSLILAAFFPWCCS